jgi:nicotinamide mononucleotide transporter
MKRFGESLILAFVLTYFSYGIGQYMGWVKELNLMEIFSVFTTYSCTYMCVKQTRWNYPMGALATASLCYVFYQADLLGQAAQNALLTPWLLYGWFRWRADAITRPVTSVFSDSKVWLTGYVGLTAISYLVCLKAIEAYGGTMAPLDTLILVLSILAQIMLDNKKLENWYLWAVVNVIAIYVNFEALPMVAMQFVFLLANTVWGWSDWAHSQNQDKKELANV